MRRFAERVVYLAAVILAVTAISFALLNILPGDVTAVMLGEGLTREAMVQTRAALGLDDPVVVRYGRWLAGAVTGDLGRSFITGEPVFEAIMHRLPISAQLMVMAQLIGLALALPTGILAAYRQGRLFDRLITSAAFSVVALPIFVVAMLLMFLFAVTLHWLPSVGYVAPSQDLAGNLRGMILPAVAIGLAEWPLLMRVLRSDMIATLQEDFITAARAKGLTPARILFRHALRPSSFTLVTIIGFQIAGLITGALLVETIFALPGIGRLLIESVHARDLFMVQGVVSFIAVIYVGINFAVDALYYVMDPRIRRP